ncbi:TonB-dependent receptor [Taibaiella lutea]|uniref:TonB-dependent receptor n=1 Tax=Taibaiella lutea TaxID=2608001 RepID=A0A5M6CGP0_9BACT|nr:TonB-dependent siderophore receptor [Taibaiella lutea]KAA5532289.1 TonB-dependent receptor [Taibaiella lutea]
MKKIFMIFGASLLSLAASAQSGEVKGRVLRHDGLPATQVVITLDNADEVTTDNDGVFIIDATPGKHTITIHGAGIKNKTVDITVSEDKTIEVADIYLSKSNTDLDEIVIGDTRNQYVSNTPSNSLRIETPVLETPQNIQIITGKVLADQMATTFRDGVIRNVSGATMLEHWGDMYARINARGSRLAAFRNGVNITSNWGPLTEDLAFVDHVEFVKGPAGFMMSTGEPSGIYNTVTKRPTGETKGEANFMMGSYDFYRASVDLDGKFDKEGKVLYRLNVLGQTKNSFRQFEYNDRYGFAPVITYKFDDKTTFTAEYIFQHAKMSNVGTYYVFATNGYAKLPRNFTLADPGLDPTTVNDHNINLNLQHKFNDDWKLTAQLSYFNYQQVGSSMWTGADLTDSLGNITVPAVGADGKVIRNVSIWDASNIMKFGQVYLNGNIQTGAVHQRILAGIDAGDKEYIADWNDGFNLDTYESPFDVNNPTYGNPSNGYHSDQFRLRRESMSLVQRAGIYGMVNQSYASAYVQDELAFFENRLRLTIAGRYTYVKNNDYNTVTEAKKFTPRIGLSYSIDKATSAYALYDQAFVPQSGIKKDGSTVKPLTGDNMEIGIKRDWMDGKWNTCLSVYRILKNNAVAGDPSDPTGRYSIEFGQTKTQGIEFDIRGEIVRGLTLTANYAYTDSKITKDLTEANVGTVVPGFAKHTANAWLNYKIMDGVLNGLGISGGASYMADRSTWTWGGTGTNNLPTYFRLDGGLFYEKGKVRVSADIFNITDKYLYSGAAYAAYYYWQAEAGRNWRMGVTYRF